MVLYSVLNTYIVAVFTLYYVYKIQKAKFYNDRQNQKVLIISKLINLAKRRQQIDNQLPARRCYNNERRRNNLLQRGAHAHIQTLRNSFPRRSQIPRKNPAKTQKKNPLGKIRIPKRNRKKHPKIAHIRRKAANHNRKLLSVGDPARKRKAAHKQTLSLRLLN